MLASEIISRVKNLFGDSNSVIITPTMIIEWINDGEMEIARETQYKITSAAAAASTYIAGVSLSGLILISRIKYGSVPLALLANETIDRLLLAETPVGTPQAYYMLGELVYLFPTPAGTDSTSVTAYYVGTPTVVTAAENTLSTPDRYRVDLLNFCISKAHERNENYRAAELYYTRFMAGISQRRFESLTQDDSFTVVGPDYEDHHYNYVDLSY